MGNKSNWFICICFLIIKFVSLYIINVMRIYNFLDNTSFLSTSTKYQGDDCSKHILSM